MTEYFYYKDFLDFEPSTLLPKPLEKGKISQILIRALKRKNNKKSLFYYRWGRDLFTKSVREIYYLRVDRRGLMMVHMDGEEKISGTLREACAQLEVYGFYQVSRSYSINYHMVRRFYVSKVEMANGDQIEIAKKRQKPFQEWQKKLTGTEPADE